MLEQLNKYTKHKLSLVFNPKEGDLKGWNIPKDLALDRSAWKTAIHVPEP